MDVVNSLSLAYNDKRIYCSFFTNNGTAVIRHLQLDTSEFIMGDINADSKFNIADVVILQKWLLDVSDTKLADWKAGDLCKDGRLDVFDLCLLKQALMKSLT